MKRQFSVLIYQEVSIFNFKKRQAVWALHSLKWINLKASIFQQIFIYHQMIALQKLWKMLFILSKQLFLFSRYLTFCISSFHSFFPCQPLLQSLIEDKSFKVYDIINFLNKNLIIHLVWYLEKKKRYGIKTLSIDKVLNKEHFYGKIMQKMCNKSYSKTLFLLW